MTIHDRFLFFLRESNISQKEFCNATGYSPQSLSKFLSKKTENPGVNLYSLTSIHYPRVNIKWLMTGEGSMWETEALGGDISEDAVAGEELFFFDDTTSKATVSSIYSDLLKTKDKLIQAQEVQIENLKKELKNCKKK